MAKLRPQILAIDDTPANLQALGAALDMEFDLQIATSGAMGLKLAAQFHPDVILLDVMMPEMDGFEVCRLLMANPALRMIPVIFLTALSSSESESSGLALGAADYITKPINVEIAKHRIRNLLEREGLRSEVTSQRDEMHQLVTKLTQATELLEQARVRELGIGRSIQRSLLQGDAPGSFAGAAFGVLSEPSQGIDGDFYDIRQLNANCFDVLVGDVMGKGVQAALIGAGIKTAYHQALADLVIAKRGPGALPTPAEIVNQLHRELTPRLIALASFATLVLYRFDLTEKTLTYVNAGHTPGLLLREDQAAVVQIHGDNLPIGIVAAEDYKQHRIAIGFGDSLLVYSDGITEAQGAAGEEFGCQRLSDQVEAWSKADSCIAKLDSLRQVLQNFAAGKQAADDQSAILIELRRPLPT